MKYIQKFESFITETSIAGPSTAPSTPDVRPDIDTPTKPSRPERPSKPITRPSTDPAPKAKKKVTESDVAKRFINDLNRRGESIEKYLNK